MSRPVDIKQMQFSNTLVIYEEERIKKNVITTRMKVWKSYLNYHNTW